MRPEQVPTLLLVHGAWHGAWYWEEKFAPWMRERGLQVETINLPGHGVPGTGRIGWYSITDYVDAVERKLQQMPGPVVVAGHSMGGFVVQKLLERRPANLAGAILANAATPGGVFKVVLSLIGRHPVDFLIANLSANLYRLVRTPERTRELFFTGRMSDAEVETYWSRLSSESFRAFLDMLVLNPPRPGRADPALPKLISGGSLDAVFPPSVIESCAKAYGVKAMMFDGLAHSMHLDAGWETVAQQMLDWMSQTYPALAQRAA